jgi:pyruvate-formate lyase-activating enzyme
MTTSGPESSKTFCILPWMHLAVMPEGTTRVCCVASQPVEVNGAPASVQTHGLDAIWNSAHMRRVRQRLLEGKHVADCSTCYLAEKNGGFSQRVNSNMRWAEQLGEHYLDRVHEASGQDHVVADFPLSYHLIPGNNCNLKCRMCFPVYSSRIERDEVHSAWSPTPRGLQELPSPAGQGMVSFFRNILFRKAQPDLQPRADLHLPNGPWYRDDAWTREVLLQNVDHLEGLYFTGGEPMIEKQVEKILDYVIERQAAGHVTLEINTNCTVIRDEMMAKLAQFKKVVLALSLDAYGPYQEYIRYPSKWAVIRQNAEKLAAMSGPQLVVVATPVVQVYNVLNLVEVFEFFDEQRIPYGVRFASLPWFLAVDVLPGRVKQVAVARLKAYAERCPGERRDVVLSAADQIATTKDRCNQEALRTLMLFTNDLDASRGQNFRQVHGELLGLLEAEGFSWTNERVHAAVDAVNLRVKWLMDPSSVSDMTMAR